MPPSFDVEELKKLPPAQRIERLKALKQQIEKESEQLEEESIRQLTDEQEFLETLLKEQAEQERREREEQQKKGSKLEETVKNSPESEEKPETKSIEYGKGVETIDSKYQQSFEVAGEGLVDNPLKAKSIYESKTDYKF